MRLTSACLFLACAILSACQTAQFAPSQMHQTYASRTPAEMIEIFRSTKPTKPYFEIGAVTDCCSPDSNSMINQLRASASTEGGDALIDLDLNAAGGISASVIRYK